MAHERALIDRNSQLPVAGTVTDIEFERIGLYNAAKRLKNPACSHTMARYPLKYALDLLAEWHGENSEWRAELNDLTNTIYQLDHEKGETEKQSARLIKKLLETKTEGH